MEILNFFDSDDQQHWLAEIRKGDWGAAKFLAELLEKGSFMETLCEPENNGRLFLLTEGERLLSFLTLTRQDCVRDLTKMPWIGFVYTFPEYRGQGCCRRLMAYAEKEAAKLGYNEVYVATDHEDLYEHMGYTYIGSVTDVYNEESRVYQKKIQ